ncbi:MAG TPA: LytTR family DNA-binding domain-containing protein, partial [Chitinophagaceae bacterium]|nr:LytTR family DNA-binding domain-containing protein [Chitinophagaceae bacterium]
MKEKLSCYIVDDEHLAQEILEEYISKVPFLYLLGSYISPLEASTKMKVDNPDLIFLDINMPNLDGLSFIPMLQPRPMIILTTAYDQYALKAYELEVEDYLLKPFSFERFYKAVLRLYHNQSRVGAEEKEKTEAQDKKEFIFLKVGHRIQKIAVRDIIFIQAVKDYLRIHTTKESILTLMSFAKLEEHLPPQNFARVHRSYIVAIDKIDHIEKREIKIANELIPISETYSEAFFKRLKGLE